ncbi:MAG: Rv3654c family TadE-like protein [Marmoricola sp.]
MTPRRTGPDTGRDQCGAATVVAVAACLLLATVTAACVGAAGIVVSHRRAEAAADLAALAAAQAVQAGRHGCAAAQRVGSANGAELTACSVSGFDVTVEVTVTSARLLGHSVGLAGRARAGPVRHGP